MIQTVEIAVESSILVWLGENKQDFVKLLHVRLYILRMNAIQDITAMITGAYTLVGLIVQAIPNANN
jgi:hypothetical protein